MVPSYHIPCCRIFPRCVSSFIQEYTMVQRHSPTIVRHKKTKYTFSYNWNDRAINLCTMTFCKSHPDPDTVYSKNKGASVACFLHNLIICLGFVTKVQAVAICLTGMKGEKNQERCRVEVGLSCVKYDLISRTMC